MSAASGTADDGIAALIERNLAAAVDFADLTVKQAEVVAQQGWRILDETRDEKKASMVIKGLAAGMRKSIGIETAEDRKRKRCQEVTVGTAKFHADVWVGNQFKNRSKPKNIPEIDQFVTKLAAALQSNPSDKTKEKIEKIIANQEYLGDAARNALTSAMRNLAGRWGVLADRLEVDGREAPNQRRSALGAG